MSYNEQQKLAAEIHELHTIIMEFKPLMEKTILEHRLYQLNHPHKEEEAPP